jgi:transmembrane sensor
MAKFDILLQRYLNHTATDAEKIMLFQLIRSGEYHSKLNDSILASLQNEDLLPASEAEKLMIEKVYSEKLGKHILSRKDNTSRHKLAIIRPWLMAAAVFAGMLIGILWIARDQEGARPVSSGIKSVESDTSHDGVVSYADRQIVRLPDGSTVLLNKGSKLSYRQSHFGDTDRQVSLTGEAFFDIRHDAARPFVVHTGKITTTVLGTAFNIRSLPGEKEVRVTVTRGKVKVGDDRKTFAMITPDQEMIVNTATNGFVKQNVNAEIVSEWKDKFLIMDNVTMQEALSLISKRFGVKLVLKDETLNKCHISATFLNDEGLDHVLKVIGTFNQIKHSYNSDGSVTLEGGLSCQ